MEKILLSPQQRISRRTMRARSLRESIWGFSQKFVENAIANRSNFEFLRFFEFKTYPHGVLGGV